MKHDQLFYLVNVLGSDAYADCHIKGSINVPLDTLEEWAETVDTHIPIVIYCASYACHASYKAYKLLEGLGFHSVQAYEGGTAEWRQLGYPVVGKCVQDYLQQISQPEERDIKTISAQEVKKLLYDYGYLQD